MNSFRKTPLARTITGLNKEDAAEELQMRYQLTKEGAKDLVEKVRDVEEPDLGDEEQE